MSTVTYKCPNCGGPLEFKPELQKSKCEYCLSEFTDEELQAIDRKLEEETSPDKKMMGYICDSCGAEVVTEETTSATFCYFCHNPVLLTDRLTGEFKPDKIIPFAYEKEKAVENFRTWAKTKKYVPKEFYSHSQLEKITGMYIPYWTADFRADVDYSGKGTQNRVWVTGNTEHTEIKEYAFQRQGEVDIHNVPEIAMRKIEKELLDSIAPYDESQAVDFSMSYLSGFFAEKYDISREEAKPQLEDRARSYADSLVRGSIGSYQNVSLVSSKLDISEQNWCYTLMPVWVLTYRYKNKTYVYAVNGQNGKAFGELPLNRKKLGLISALIAVGVFNLALIGGLLIW